MGSEGCFLLGVVAGEGVTLPRSAEFDSVPLRDLVALVRRIPPRAIEPTSTEISAYRATIEGVFRDRAVLPAPFGTVFKSRDALVRWMELHYVALCEGLAWVRDRAAARLVLAADAATPTPDYEAAVFESMRFLNRHAVASVMLPDESDGKPRTAEASFLVEREKWSAFSDAVREEQERVSGISIQQSGPWPAYDFVRLQFGS